MKKEDYNKASKIVGSILRKKGLLNIINSIIKEDGVVHVKLQYSPDEYSLPEEVVQFWQELLQTQIDELSKQFEEI